MTDQEKVIERLQKVSSYFKSMLKVGYDGDAEIYREHRESIKMAIALLKEQEPREITKDEWETWKKAKYRDPLCMYWHGDIMPFWILRLEEVHEPAYLIGDIKIFNGKPAKEKMHEIWLNSCR